MDRLLNFGQPIDIALLDKICDIAYTHAGTNEQEQAQKVLNQFKEKAEAWTRVGTILSTSKSIYSKFFALQVLNPIIQYRWNALPKNQRESIKNFVLNQAIEISMKEESLRTQKMYLDKLNFTIVQVIKQEWPHNWGSFVKEITEASKTNECLCENNMYILKTLSEEVFDFSQGQMTQAKIKELKTTFTKEFSMIYELCEFVLSKSCKQQLLNATLNTLYCFLSWIPIGYIFRTNMIAILINKFFVVQQYRNATLKCLIEIGSLNLPEKETQFGEFFKMFMTQLVKFLPIDTDIAGAVDNGTNEDSDFIEDLALFLVAFFKQHLKVIEMPQYQQYCVAGHTILAHISLVNEEEIFKICLEYWGQLTKDLFEEAPLTNNSGVLMIAHTATPRRSLYASVLTKVRIAMISRMAKPEEVLITEDENGDIIREVLPDTDSILLYKSMKESLIYLTHLDPVDTTRIMKERLTEQTSRSGFTWNKLNTLCWAIGSISGAQQEEQEKKFLVFVIRDLLQMCEQIKGKSNKAVIASNIMYIVGQYPNFLKAHWRFLLTVVNKLFEFMHESHPGVQDMACDTFLKISKSCKQKFIVTQAGANRPHILTILQEIKETISDLEPQQIRTFYEALGHMVSACPDATQRERILDEFMRLPNESWQGILNSVEHSVDKLKEVSTANKLAEILKLNVRVASSLGACYIYQLKNFYLPLLHVYRAYSAAISEAVRTANGKQITLYATVKSWRSVKQEILKLLAVFIQKSENPEFVQTTFIPPLLEAVLGDYRSNIPDARDPEVLALMTVIIDKFKGQMIKQVPTIFANVFECTLKIISQRFEEFPDHRINFFKLLRSINAHCFPAFFSIPNNQFKIVIDSIVWAMKYTRREVSDMGLLILLELWNNISTTSIAGAFYQTYITKLLASLFFVLTDTFHKSGFKLQATMISVIISSVVDNKITVPLYDQAKTNFPDNKTFLREFIIKLIGDAFKNLTKQQVIAFVDGLFMKCNQLEPFKSHLRDFLVQSKEFSGQDNSDLYAEELERKQKEELKRRQMIPGMIKPSEKNMAE